MPTLFRTYDVVIDTEQWHRLTAVVTRLIRCKIRIGFATNERKKMFTHAVDYNREQAEADSFFRLFEPLGVLPAQEPVTPFLTIPAD
ncbi:MAG: glycosyltransferase family 9 protein, partial [Desulfuromonadales bacterium]|nr:glycosyltransferase family 9 protein [Desulfuromonadales bacterium]